MAAGIMNDSLDPRASLSSRTCVWAAEDALLIQVFAHLGVNGVNGAHGYATVCQAWALVAWRPELWRSLSLVPSNVSLHERLVERRSLRLLEELRLKHLDETDHILRTLIAAVPALKHLFCEFGRQPVRVDTLRWLLEHPHARFLKKCLIDGTKDTIERLDLNPEVELPEMRYFVLGQPILSHISLRGLLSAMPNLNEVSIYDSPEDGLSPAGLRLLAEACPKLQRLDVQCRDWLPQTADAIRQTIATLSGSLIAVGGHYTHLRWACELRCLGQSLRELHIGSYAALGGDIALSDLDDLLVRCPSLCRLHVGEPSYVLVAMPSASFFGQLGDFIVRTVASDIYKRHWEVLQWRGCCLEGPLEALQNVSADTVLFDDCESMSLPKESPLLHVKRLLVNKVEVPLPPQTVLKGSSRSQGEAAAAAAMHEVFATHRATGMTATEAALQALAELNKRS